MTRLALRLAAAIAATAAAAPLLARDDAPFTVVETGETFDELQDAVDAIGGGTGTIRIAAGRHRDCAVQEAGRIAFVAETPGQAVFDGEMCEGKATLVLRGEWARVDGLVFTHMEVEDGNGAGIRIEQGDLVVSHSLFVDGQCGILSASDPNGTIVIERSTFSGLGKHPDGSGAHALYIGGYGSLKVTNTRFERGDRAARGRRAGVGAGRAPGRGAGDGSGRACARLRNLLRRHQPGRTRAPDPPPPRPPAQRRGAAAGLPG